MKKRTKRPRLPRWIWQLGPDILNSQEKHFLAYVWWCSDRGCRDWDYSLSARFGKCKRTMRRWIKHLRDMKLITVNFPGTKSRTLYKKPYYKREVWLAHRRQRLDSQGRTLMSYINNAKHKKEYKTTPSYAKPSNSLSSQARSSMDAGNAGNQNETRPIANRTVSQGRPQQASPRPAVQGNDGSFSRQRKKDAADLHLEKIRAKKRLEKGLPN